MLRTRECGVLWGVRQNRHESRKYWARNGRYWFGEKPAAYLHMQVISPGIDSLTRYWVRSALPRCLQPSAAADIATDETQQLQDRQASKSGVRSPATAGCPVEKGRRTVSLIKCVVCQPVSSHFRMGVLMSSVPSGTPSILPISLWRPHTRGDMACRLRDHQ